MTASEEEKGAGGALIPRLTVSGGTDSTFDFGNVVKGNFTVISLTRYTGGRKERILQGNSNWLHGHWRNNAGVAHYDGWKTPEHNDPGSEGWLCYVGQNGGECIHRANGVSSCNVQTTPQRTA